MKVVIFGASGLIGGGVLMEALDSPEVTAVLSVGRRTLDVEHAKLRQIVHDDFDDFLPLADDLTDLDACFWCLGIASSGVDEQTYTRITVDFTLAAADVLRERSPNLCFCFVSGAGTDESERGRFMWARVKGRAENALRGYGFARVAMFRPGFIRQSRGGNERGAVRRLLQPLSLPFYALARLVGGASSNAEIGKAMIAVAKGESDATLLTSADINALAATPSSQS